MSLNFFQAIGRFFHKSYHVLAGIAAAFGMLPLAGLIEAAGELGVGANSKINDSDLPQSDQNILTPWDDNQFTPFFTDLIHNLQVNVLDQTKNLQTRIPFLNDIFLKMAAVVLYYQNNETAGLSDDGIISRNEYIHKTFDAIYTFINDNNELNKLKTINVTKNFKSIALTYLQIPTTSADFTISTTVFQTNSGTPVVATPAQVATAPQITPDAVAQLIDQVKGTTTVLDTPKETIPPTPPTSSSHTGIKILGFGLLVALALKFGFKTKK